MERRDRRRASICAVADTDFTHTFCDDPVSFVTSPNVKSDNEWMTMEEQREREKKKKKRRSDEH